MAKKNLSVTYKNCEINLTDMTITEVSKDDVNIFNILDVFKIWEKEDGVDITIKKASDITSDVEEDE